MCKIPADAGIGAAQVAARAQEIADDLIGTAQSLSYALEDGEEENGPLMDAVYGLCFECGRCGWWASTEELNDDSGEELCDECHEDDTQD